MDLAETLKEGLSSKTVFNCPGYKLDEATVVTWIIMAVITRFASCSQET
jgi:hypothetical protein